jgi:mRNA interferase HigB
MRVWPSRDGLHVISRKRLREFWKKHPDSETPLSAWYKAASRADWKSITDVRKTYPHADAVGRCTVFNVGGHDYRLIVKINYSRQVIYIRSVVTHAEYDKERWQRDCES